MILKKLNENQIQCILTAEELQAEHVRFLDLVRGTPPARAMIDKVLRWAFLKFDYNLQGMPFRIEAMPVHQGKVLVRITRVSMEEAAAGGAPAARQDEDEEDDLPVRPIAPKPVETPILYPGASAFEFDSHEPLPDEPLLWNFPSLADLMAAVEMLSPLPDLPSALYKDDRLGGYMLILWQFPAEFTADDANRFCELLSEYAFRYIPQPGFATHAAEHMTPIIEENALAKIEKASQA